MHPASRVETNQCAWRSEGRASTATTVLSTASVGGLISAPSKPGAISETGAVRLSKTKVAGIDPRVSRASADARSLRIEQADLGPVLHFGSWAGRAEYHLPLEVYTVNYALLIERVLEKLGVAYFDGLSARCMHGLGREARLSLPHELRFGQEHAAEACKVGSGFTRPATQASSLIDRFIGKYEFAERRVGGGLQSRLAGGRALRLVGSSDVRRFRG